MNGGEPSHELAPVVPRGLHRRRDVAFTGGSRLHEVAPFSDRPPRCGLRPRRGFASVLPRRAIRRSALFRNPTDWTRGGAPRLRAQPDLASVAGSPVVEGREPFASLGARPDPRGPRRRTGASTAGSSVDGVACTSTTGPVGRAPGGAVTCATPGRAGKRETPGSGRDIGSLAFLVTASPSDADRARRLRRRTGVASCAGSHVDRDREHFGALGGAGRATRPPRRRGRRFRPRKYLPRHHV